MTIYVKNVEGGSLEVVTGHMRLQVQLQVEGKALVQNMATGVQLEVHEVGGELVALTQEAAAAVQSAADVVITHAAKR